MKKFILSVICLLSLIFVLSSCDMGRQNYDVTFDSNGGTSVETQSVAHDKTATRPENPTKEGHTFIDWYSDEEFKTVYDFNKKVRKSITLYANWSVNEYNLSYVTNVDSYNIKGKVVEYGKTIETPKVDENLFKIEGSHFVGWYIDANFETAFNLTTMPARDLTLYAKWDKNDFKLTFICDDLTYKTLDVKYGDTIPSIETPTKTGHVFAGWLLSKTGNEVVSDDYKITKNLTLYAKWTKNNYTITFDSKGGTTIPSVEYAYFDSIIAPAAPLKEGYTFAGWYLNDEYFNFNDAKMPAENITLEAKWNANTYTVKFNSNGGTEIADAKVVFGNKISEPSSPTKVGYTFAGWYIGEELYDFESLIPANNVTLVAKWTANEYTINFDLNGVEGTIESIKTKYDETVKTPECNIDRIGYTFVKWNTKADGTGINYLELTDLKNISTGEDVTLYAIWMQNEYTLTVTLSQTEIYTQKFHYGDSIEKFISDINTIREDAEFAGWYELIDNSLKEFNHVGATMPNNNLAVVAKFLGEVTITFISNKEVFDLFTGIESEEITNIVKNPTKEGYTFAGWYLDEKYENVYNLTVYPNDDINVYAKWTVNTITVKFDGNGSTSGQMENQTIVYDSNTALTLNTFEKVGHKFLGWSTDKDSLEIAFVDGYNKNVASEGEVTLYAIWETLKYSISFDSQEGSQVDKIEGLYGKEVVAPNNPTKEGYTFAGWFLNDVEYTFSTIPAENITLIAKWNANKYTLTINTKIDGVEQDVKMFDIYFNELILGFEAITKYALEGYNFSGWYYNVDLTDKAEFNNASIVEGDIVLYASYQIVQYKVNFISNGEVLYTTTKNYKEAVSFNEYIETTKLYALAYGQLATAVANVVAGADNGTALLACIQTNMQYYMSNEALMSYIGVLAAGGSLTSTQWQEFYGVAKGLYDGAQSIVNIYESNKIGDSYVPNHAGHFFVGWYLGADTVLDGKTNVLFTNITPASTIGLDTVNIVAKWEKLTPVEDLSDIDGTNNIITWTQIDSYQLKPEEDETLVIDYLIYNVNADGSLTLLDVVKHDDSKDTLQYVFMTADTFSAPGYYNLVVVARAQILNSNNEVIRTYESDVNESNVLEDFKVVVDPDSVNITSSGDYYSVADDTFYLFTNMEYKFNTGGVFDLVNPEHSIYATLEGNTIKTTGKAGYFEFTNTANDGTVKTYKAHVLPYVSQFTLGKGLSNFLDSNSNSSAFYGKNATYTIGRYFEDDKLTELYNDGIFEYKDNGYRFDLNILTNGGISIDTRNFGNYLVYNFYDSNNEVVDNIGEYDNETDSWSFTAPNGDYRVEISINPLYVAPKQVKDELIKTLSFNFTIDNSVNVYNNEQFRAVYNNTKIGDSLYSDGSVIRGISIHQNIVAELQSNQYYDYWKDNPINPAVLEGVDNKYNQKEALKTHTPINIDNSEVLKLYDLPNYANGNAYERVSNKELYETFNINGNCYTIDGSNLPIVSIYSRGNQSSVTGYYVPYNATAILKYVVSGNFDTSVSKLVLNDLHIVGNSTKPVLDESSENFQTSIQLMNKNAAGFMAVNLGYGATLEVNNSFITKSTIAFNLNRNCSGKIVDTKVVDCWFNGIYGYANSDITITNSYFKDFGGAIIHLEDLDSAVKVDSVGNILEEYAKPANITIDTNTVLENYVSGDEGFFKSYSLEVLIMQLKSGFESNVNKQNWTMIKRVKDPITGLDYEKVNLMMLLVARGDNAEEVMLDSVNNIKGAGRNMMNLGFDAAHTPMKLAGLNQAMGMNLTHINSSLLLDRGLPQNVFNGTDIVALKTNPEYTQAGYLEEGILLTYQPSLPGFGGSIIVTGVNGMPNK